jgi:lysophospholipase L1-like esterase
MEEVARQKGVGVFPRYEIMRYWFENEQMPYARFIGRDGLHMNDYGYACIGRLLAAALERAIAK